MRHLPIAALFVLLAACAASSNGDECQIGADCPSGACQNGTCVDTDGPTSTSASAGGGLGGTTGSGGAGATSGPGGGGSFCANHDFVVEQGELTLEPGLSAQLLAAQGVVFSTAGSEQVDGTRIWDFTAALPGDHGLVVSTIDLAGTWYESSFLGATYAARLSDAEELLGVFEATTDALVLRGVVSPSDGITRTELVYDPPVTVLDFPVSEGKTWNSATTITGLAQGVAVFYTEDYAFEVDARGQALTPYGEIEVLRVHSELVRTIGALVTTVQSHSFVAECFGSVATVVSEDQEFEKEFTDAAEVRRLAP